MLLGLAVGDSLGNTSESTSPGERRQRHGEIRDYLLHSYHGDRRGYPTDDTQLAAWTLEHVLEEGCIVPERLAERFAADRIFGLGSTVRQFLVNWKSGLNWRECGPASAGNGALMRIAPVLLPHLAAGDCELWADVVLASALTHNDYTSTSACLAFTAMLWDLLAMDTPPPSIWWETRYVELAADLEGDVDLHTRGAPSRSGRARSGASCRTSSHGPGDSNLRHVKHATAGTLAPSC
jgi:ADP-ribosylglycohydrolase